MVLVRSMSDPPSLRFCARTFRNGQSVHALGHPLLQRPEKDHDKRSQFPHVRLLGRDYFISDLQPQLIVGVVVARAALCTQSVAPEDGEKR